MKLFLPNQPMEFGLSTPFLKKGTPEAEDQRKNTSPNSEDNPMPTSGG